MGSLYRSVEMCRCQLFIQSEASFHCISELGELGLTMFRDLNPDVTQFQRHFVSEVRRCNEMERQLRFVEKEIKMENIDILELSEIPICPPPTELANLESLFEKLETDIKEMNENNEILCQNFTNLQELKNILFKAQLFFPEAAIARLQLKRDKSLEFDSGDQNLMTDAETLKMKFEHADLDYIVGTIHQNKVVPFERVLWRASRGNVFLRLAPIEEPIIDPKTREPIEKSIFVVFFQGQQLKSRVKKIIEGFQGTSYDIPDTPEERRTTYEGVLTRIDDLNVHRRRILSSASQNIRRWFSNVWKMKGIYHIMNLFSLDVTHKCFIAECWLPNDNFGKVQLALQRGTEASGASAPSILNRLQTDQTPPTWYRTNKFTAGFQSLVESYGVASYREANPTPFTIITFPFLFAVMFGDLGHGFIMFLFALFLVVKENYLERQRIRDEIFNIFFAGRYIILLMGLFSIYTGAIYNELFSKSFNLFGSSWKMSYSNDTIRTTQQITLDPANSDLYIGHPYPFGNDPVWSPASNKLTFFNSFKMKMSVIIGISQMLLGVFISLSNYVYFKSALDIFAVFVPQLLFITSIFVYLCGLIFYKWIAFSASPTTFPLNLPYDPLNDTCNPNVYLGTNCAPSLLIGLINMFMFSEGPPGFCTNTCATSAFYPFQAMIQHILVIIAIICVPWMLLVKPFVLRSRHQKKIKRNYQHVILVENGLDDENGDNAKEKQASTEEFDFSEVFIHQCIHTIEYCLGCISHTASYLRLWALSLAHSELSEVLWTMVMSIGFQMQGYIGGLAIFAIFWAFAGITIAVLLVMEGLSAFLHALRLHWVEFQSKFYMGEGYQFEPFSFKVILAECEETLIENN